MMTKWITEHWYVVLGIAGGALYIWFGMSHNPEEGSAFRRLRAILRPGTARSEQAAAQNRALSLRDVCIVLLVLFVVLVVIPYFFWP